MAKLTPEISQNIALLKQQLLDIVDEATAAELTLFERFGETSETMTPLNDLRDIAEQASTRFSQFANIQGSFGLMGKNVHFCYKLGKRCVRHGNLFMG
ncbi:hypothetical protein [Floridanema aerugineum]|jgi:hypothetical protein|uniref:Uncharacterized protein n=1 Tax=Floridaenema aerugineum BLCC-F46 TaxID=3153654 RepID=A0ABV4XBN2_9CYAN